MATITSAVLTIPHDHTKKTATPTVQTTIQFSNIELQKMVAIPGRWFKLKCEIWSKDTLFNNPARPWDQTDDKLYTFNEVFYFSDGTPAPTESRTFKALIGIGLLNEDLGVDEIYAKVRLTNLITGITVSRVSNLVRHNFEPVQSAV